MPPSSNDKMAVWRAYELMEQKAGNLKAVQQVYQRSMGEYIAMGDDDDIVLERDAVSFHHVDYSFSCSFSNRKGTNDRL